MVKVERRVNENENSEYTLTQKIIKTIFLVLTWAMIGLYTEISGTTQKDLIIKTNSDYELVSRAISGRSFGYFIGSFIGGPLVDKLGNYCDLMIAISLDGAAIATIIAPYSSNVGMLGVLLVIGGTFEGVINIAGQKLILNLWKRKATGPLHILHFGFGMGSFIVPQIANPFLAVLAPSLDITNASSINGTKSPFVIDPVTVTTTTTNNTIAVIFLKESKIESAYLIVSIIVASLSVVFFLYQFFCINFAIVQQSTRMCMFQVK
ncbi:Hypothetical predicted protein [Mytilus galloprovincialis]|uniref:Major facilitator superfamily (MFS) profile domain-containing protein n=1 Tax=Mytilus galloprovincialis TaxID=29158 RepID=A0A8B6DMU4_MYTGA|nr:Hypothetical predicted protein [Mytilus galloprovincialis]